MSLDYADGRYLNTVGANLGLTRPRTGFSDDSWRAVVKAIALSYKQITTKFEELLAIFFGPRVTVSTALTQNASIGDTHVFMKIHEDWPQLGTVIIDEGLTTEETLNYCLIDRHTNTMYLNSALTFDHVACADDGQQLLLAINQNTNAQVVVPDISVFPDPSVVGDYTTVIGAGTDAEESVVVTAVDNVNRVLTLSSALVNTHDIAVVSDINTQVVRTYNPVNPGTGLIQEQGMTLLALRDVTQFPDTGTVLLGPAGPGAGPTDSFFFALGGSPTFLSIHTGAFEVGGHSGNIVRFADNTPTVALQGLEFRILTNVGNQLVFAETLPAAPAIGELFQIRAVAHYVDVDRDENRLVLSKHIPNLSIESDGVLVSDTIAAAPPSTISVLQLTTGGLTVDALRGLVIEVGTEVTEVISNTASTITVLPFLSVPPPPGTLVTVRFSTLVELLEPVNKWNQTGEAVEVAQLKSPGTGWSIRQTTPRCVEVVTPDALQDVTDIRSASYLHTTGVSPTPVTTLVGAVLAGDSTFEVADPSTFPVAGVVDVAGDLVGYHSVQSYITAHAVSGSTSLEVPDSSRFPVSGSLVLDPGSVNQETVTITGNDLLTNTLTVLAITNTHWTNTSVRGVIFTAPHGTFSAPHAAASPVSLYQPRYTVPVGNTVPLNGNLWLLDSVFPGPYIYKPDELTFSGFANTTLRSAPNAGPTSAGLTTNTQLLPGPTQVAMQQIPEATPKTAIEVLDATPFDVLTIPFFAQIGVNTGNLERVQVQGVYLRQRVYGEVVSVGTSSIEFTAVGDSFPDLTGYRVLVDSAGTPEVVYVREVTLAPPTLVLESALTTTPLAGATLELMADVLATPALLDVHDGAVRSYASRSTATETAESARFPEITSDHQVTAEYVIPELTELTVNDASGFPASGGAVYLNFGKVGGGVSNNIPPTVQARTTSSILAGQTAVPVPDATVFPVLVSPLTPFEIVLDPGGLKEERLLIQGAIGNNLQLIAGTSLRFNHPVRSWVQHTTSKEELLFYETVSGNSLSFSAPIMLQFNHSPGESATLSTAASEPSTDGYDFPFYLPPDLSFRLASIMDLVRAAGIQVKFVTSI